MSTFETMQGGHHTVEISSVGGVIDSVEKWETTSTTVSTKGKRGGGFLYKGTGFLSSPSINSQVTVNSARNTRLHVTTTSGISDSITCPGVDIPVIEGTEIDILFYEEEGQTPQVAGITDHRTSMWYLLNPPEVYLRELRGMRVLESRMLMLVASLLTLGGVLSLAGVASLGSVLVLAGAIFALYKIRRGFFGIIALTTPQRGMYDTQFQIACESIKNDFLLAVGASDVASAVGSDEATDSNSPVNQPNTEQSADQE